MRKWIVTVGGAGMIPVAPGTWGSILTSLILLGIYLQLPPDGTHGWPWQVILLGGLLVFSALSVALGPWAVRYYQKKDPSSFVLDEAAGICLTMLLLPASNGWREVGPLLIGLATFRLFDITKPPPARQLERLPAGWGILLDDLAAAVYANLLAQMVLWML